MVVIVSEGLPGYAEELTAKIEKETGYIARFCCLAHVQRGGCPTLEDRLSASEMGAAAVESLLAGKSNIIICKNEGKICDVDIMKAHTLDTLYKGKLTEEEIAAIPAEDRKWMEERCAVLKARTEEYYRLANLIK
jgi:6-phosphofructokinase 1